MRLNTLTLLFILGLAIPPAIAQDQFIVRIPANVNLSASAPEEPADPISVVLSPEALPAATVNEPYSFNLADRLSITGGTGSYNLGDVAWSLKAEDALPPGLSLENGTIAGVPTAKNEVGTSFEVTGSYQDASGQQVYTIIVGGQALKVTQIDAGSFHTCAITTTGSVKCWGENGFGQLGNNSTANSAIPVDVLNIDNVVNLSAGSHHTCAVTHEGAAKCWGYGWNGRLGNNSHNDSRIPVNVFNLANGVKSISAGANHTCAVMKTGDAKCWGRGEYGELGNASNSSSSQPLGVAGGNQFESISAGANSACGVTTTGEVKCWGHNGSGQLGTGGSGGSNLPVSVTNLGPAINVAVGHDFACASLQVGGAKCWGLGSSGQSGSGDKTSSAFPRFISNITERLASISAGSNHACAVSDSRKIYCWGDNQYGRLGIGVEQGSYVIPTEIMSMRGVASSVTSGPQHSCAMKSDGGAVCWGYNQHGWLGDGTTTTRAAPVDVLP